MKHSFIIGLLTIALTLMITSCSSDDDSGPAGNGPSIEIAAPADDSQYHYGDTVFIEVHLEHTEEIGDFHIEMIDQNTDQGVIDQMDATQESALTISGDWVNEVPTHTDFILRVTATDPMGRESMESVSFHCHPEGE